MRRPKPSLAGRRLEIRDRRRRSARSSTESGRERRSRRSSRRRCGVPSSSMPSQATFPGGESLLELQRRGVAAIEEIRSKHTKGLIAVFSHADMIKASLRSLPRHPSGPVPATERGHRVGVSAIAFFGWLPARAADQRHRRASSVLRRRPQPKRQRQGRTVRESDRSRSRRSASRRPQSGSPGARRSTSRRARTTCSSRCSSRSNRSRLLTTHIDELLERVGAPDEASTDAKHSISRSRSSRSSAIGRIGSVTTTIEISCSLQCEEFVPEAGGRQRSRVRGRPDDTEPRPLVGNARTDVRARSPRRERGCGGTSDRARCAVSRWIRRDTSARVRTDTVR